MGKSKKNEPGNFLSFALEAYWHSNDKDGNKRESIPDILGLKRWLISNSEFLDGFKEIHTVDGYILSISESQYRIDNMEDGSKKKPYTDKVVASSFNTVLSNLKDKN